MNKSEIEAKKESTWNKLKTLPNFLTADDGLNWKDSKSVTVFHELMKERNPSITREQAIEELHKQRQEKEEIMQRRLDKMLPYHSSRLTSEILVNGGAKSGRRMTMRRRRSSAKRGRKLTVKKRSKRRSTKRRRSMRSTKRRRSMRH